MDFSGRWFTTFGIMTLQQDRDRVTGTYGASGTENVIEGTAEGAILTFRYQESFEKGTGTFRLKRHGTFAGEYLAEGSPHALPWQGWREYEGCWETSLGRLRLVQQADRIDGFVEFDPEGKLEGRLEQGRFAYRFTGTRAPASGFIELDEASQTLRGEWLEDGQPPAHHRRPALLAATRPRLAGRARGALAALARRARVRVRLHAHRDLRAGITRARSATASFTTRQACCTGAASSCSSPSPPSWSSPATARPTG